MRKKILVAAIVIVLAAGGYYIYRQSVSKTAALSYVTGQVTKGTLITSVSGTGQAETSDQMDIKPQTDGRLISVKIKENQQVKADDIVAVIDPQSAANDVAKARASLDQAQASYDKLVAGATSLAIETQQINIKSAQQSLEQAKKNYTFVKTQQELAVTNAYRNYLNNGLEAVPNLGNTNRDSLSVSGVYNSTETGSYKVIQEGYGYYVQGLETSGNISFVDQYDTWLPVGTRGLYVKFPSTIDLGNDTWTISIPNSQSTSYQSSYSSYQSALQSQTQALQQAQNSIDSAQIALDKAELSLKSTLEPATSADLASAKAQITSAQAQLSNAQTAYSNTILRSPFDGTIASVKFSAGDKVTAGSIVATIITNQQVAKISLNEVEVAKVKLGQKATMTFDALDNLSITGKVVQIDTIGTVSQGVVTYNVTVAFDVQNEQVRPGMSTTVDIVIDVRQDVLIVPSAAVKTQGNQHYVQILENGGPKNQIVEIGTSNGTDMEITSGLAEGQEVITQTINSLSTTTTSKTTTGSSSLRIPGLGGGR